VKPKIIFATVFILILGACSRKEVNDEKLPLLKVSANKHFLVDENNKPFFWLGDTGWLLFKKLNREQAEKYLEDRRQKGFNVIQVMVIHDLNDATNVYGDSALIHKDITAPLVTQGDNADDEDAYDFWDHVDYIIKLAEKKGIYMALVPVWGSNIKNFALSPEQVKQFGTWLADRYKDQSNIIWLNGGDIIGADALDVWNSLGSSIDQEDPNHLITFHPRGRMQSSMWFQHENWLDFNMIQSGHRRYDQDDTELHYGEDNWRYIQTDYSLKPIRPVIDGEPSYEGIPQGLHDTLQPYWTDDDVRRYGYWSVFAGAFGYTYGHSAIMQFHQSGDKSPAYGPKLFWEQALNEPGAKQMKYLKELMLSRPVLDRIPDQSLIAEDQGEKYDYLLATRGNNYAFIYTYTGRIMKIAMGKIKGERVKASWFNPRNGTLQKIGEFENSGIMEFMPPGGLMNGNDWVLVLDSMTQI
jgi:hypothetical protein